MCILYYNLIYPNVKIKNLLLSLIFLSLFSFSFSQENKKPYLYGVPPDPPFQEAEATLTEFVTDGCSLFDKKLVGYIISNEKDNYSDIVRSISRHFNNKLIMRNKIVNKTLCRELPQLENE